MIFYNTILAIGMALMFLPFWFLKPNTVVPGVQAAINLFIFPIILVLLNIVMLLKGKNSSFPSLYVTLPLFCLLNQLVCYLNWGMATGNLVKPDAETVMLTKSFILISVGFSIILLVLGHLTLKFMRKI